MANITLPTPEELLAAGRGKYRSTYDPGGLGLVNLNAGSKNDIALSVMLALLNRLSTHVADRAAARSVQTAIGDDLIVLGQDQYFDKAKPIMSSTGTVWVQRTGSAATIIPQGSRVSVPAAGTQPAVTFTATADLPVAAGAGLVGSPLALPVQCAQPGIVGNVLQSAITKIVDVLPDSTWTITTPPGGADPSLTVIGGGAEAENDDTFRARLLLGSTDDSRSRATLRAILTGTLQVPGIATATVIEQPGSLLVFCGDVSYQLPTALKTAVLTALDSWRAYGVPVIAQGFNVTQVQVTATVNMARAIGLYNVPALQAAGINAVVTYFAQRPHPDEYFVNMISGALSKIHPEVQSVTLSSPGGDIKRLADAAYSGLTAMPRYVVQQSGVTTVSVTIAGPQTQ